MKSIAVNLLKPGLVFTEPVYIDESNILVPAGIPLRQKDIDKLKTWGVDTVKTNGDTVRTEAEKTALAQAAKSEEAGAPAAGKTAHSALSLSEVQEKKGAYRIYLSLIERLNVIFLRISKGDTVTDNHLINTISTQLLQGIRDKRAQFVGFILGGEVKGYEMAKSAVNTAILSGLTAQEIKLPHHKILYIIIGSLLHDAGMLRLPKEIMEKRGGLTETERQRMRSHPLFSQRMVTKEMNYPEEVGEIVLQHHERWDGEGYPYHFPGEKIDIGARIVSIADAFEAMVSPKPYRNSIVGYQAMKNLLADNSRRFDPDILKAFILTMGIYPIGSIVLLNNGVIARVSEARANAPLRPRIQIIIDEYKKIYKNEEGIIIDLLIEKNLYITKAMETSELLGLYA